MIDLFNHKIDVKSNKAVDITKMASNSFRSGQVKPRTIEKVKEDKIIEPIEEVKEVKKTAPKKSKEKTVVKTIMEDTDPVDLTEI